MGEEEKEEKEEGGEEEEVISKDKEKLTSSTKEVNEHLSQENKTRILEEKFKTIGDRGGEGSGSATCVSGFSPFLLELKVER